MLQHKSQHISSQDVQQNVSAAELLTFMSTLL